MGEWVNQAYSRLSTTHGPITDCKLGVNQAYSRLSATHVHITHCKLDSVVYAGVCVVI